MPSAETQTASVNQLLDNPIWHALGTNQLSFSRGNAHARRFPWDVAPLSGIPGQSAIAYSALRELLRPDESAALFLDSPPIIPPGWTLERTFEVHQMVRRASDEPPVNGSNFERLGESDVEQMLALTTLTEPGPFRRRTIELGTYLGIFSPHRQLIAMSGERLRLTGFTEISAVCTHPDYRGKGYARLLMSVLIQDIVRRGEIPFLHVKADNHAAIALYEALGFAMRTSFHLAVIRPG